MKRVFKMKIIRNMGITHKLVIINAVFVFLLLGFLIAVFLNYSKKELMNELGKSGHVISESLTYTSTLPLLSKNELAVKRSLKGVLKNPDVVYSAIYTDDMEIFGEEKRDSMLDEQLLAEIRPVEVGMELASKVETEIIRGENRDYMKILSPVLLERVGGREEIGLSEDILAAGGKGGEVIGYSVLVLTTERQKKTFEVISRRVIYITTFVFALGVIAVILVLGRFVSPLLELVKVTERVSKGDLDVEINVKAHDEVGDLAEAYKHMVQNLKEKMGQLEEKAREIDDLFEGAMDGIFLINYDHGIMRVNKEMAKSLGYGREELVRRNFGEIVKTPDYVKYLKSLVSKKSLLKEMIFLSKDGRSIPFEVHLTSVQYRNEQAVLGFARDITERKRMEKHLLQAEKLAAAGRIAANVAHEVNNPLGIITNYLTILRRELSEKEVNAPETIEIISDELRRIAGVVRGLLDFSRPEREISARTDINRLIRQTLHLMGKILENEGIGIELKIDNSIGELDVSEGHIKQVLLNLINNALDAMPDGGKLTIETAGKENGVVIRVEDNGIGINEEELIEVFSPFYTTKGVKGTGLGLSVSYGIVKGYGGEIKLSRKIEGGVIAEIFLPYNKKDKDLMEDLNDR